MEARTYTKLLRSADVCTAAHLGAASPKLPLIFYYRACVMSTPCKDKIRNNHSHFHTCEGMERLALSPGQRSDTPPRDLEAERAPVVRGCQQRRTDASLVAAPDGRDLQRWLCQCARGPLVPNAAPTRVGAPKMRRLA
jgi:hypothetical protein